MIRLAETEQVPRELGTVHMTGEVDLSLADRIEFYVDHSAKLIASSDPEIFMKDDGRTSEPYMRYFTLHWHGREIPIRTDERTAGVDRNADKQPILETHWTIIQMGGRSASKQGKIYEFNSRDEYACAASLALKALRAFGGGFNIPEWNAYPEYRRITADLMAGVANDIYGGRH